VLFLDISTKTAFFLWKGQNCNDHETLLTSNEFRSQD